MLKRSRQDFEQSISQNFIEHCEKRFKSNSANIIAKNAINSVGSLFTTIDSNRANQLSHLFLNSVKKKNLKATNQGASGRCWMFAALNTFRHVLINALDLDNFEFSEVYLFFWDKLERSNVYLKWVIDNPDKEPGSKEYRFFMEEYLSDGGWWNTFTNLANKYGLVPKSAMQETFQSDDSEEMNKIIRERIDNAVNHIRKNRDKIDTENFRKTVLSSIYDILVKFLGEPPKEFNWSFSREDDNDIVTKMTPKKFFNMINPPEININNNFVLLSHIPRKELEYYTNYSIKYTNTMLEGDCCTFINLPIHEIANYAIKSISKGVAVWFAADVRKCFNWFHSCLDDKINDYDSVFDKGEKFDKGERIFLRNVQACHAMALTGFNLDIKGRPISWQVENSWGYFDNETPGLDGFLTMSHSWFEKYVIEIVVNKNFLSRNLKNKISLEPKELDPWDYAAPALRVSGMKKPANYSFRK